MAHPIYDRSKQQACRSPKYASPRLLHLGKQFCPFSASGPGIGQRDDDGYFFFIHRFSFHSKKLRQFIQCQGRAKIDRPKYQDFP
jgi:hypothetical protein